MTDTGKKRILIVEDDPSNLKLFRDILQYKGYEILEATEGREGVVMAKAGLPDLILMDIQLPVMNGIEATRRIKEDEATRDIKVVALTANAMEGDKERMLKAGCHDYIAKPVHVTEFLERIAGYFAGREPAGKES
ncbi:MAG: response regulator [Smithellaceae bacterium]|jgi:two-component system cell cycle response regulator DivK|nr:response regulator [Smithellaceae bacterium]